METLINIYRAYYEHYINSLPIAATAKERLMKKKVFSGDFKFYLFYPRLFSAAFQIPDEEELKRLCIAGFLYYQSLINLDRAFDSREKAVTVGNIDIIQVCQEEAIKLLTGIFGMDSEFWEYWNTRKKHVYQARKIEAKGCIEKESDYETLADYKSEFGKVAIDALHVLSEKKYPDVYNHLLTSHRHFSIANQYIDDIQDIHEDRTMGQFNWVLQHLSKLVKKNGIAIKELEDAIVKKYVYTSNLATYYYQKADEHFEQAVHHAKKGGAGQWESNLEKLRRENQQRMDTIRGYNLVLQTRADIREKAKANRTNHYISIPNMKIGNTDLGTSVNYLLKEWIGGYADLKHIMYLSTLDGFANQEQVHIGDTFQRAIVTDILFDIQYRFGFNMDQVIQSEIDYLFKKRNHDQVGGWSYFPTVQEIAADIDDLAQVTQLFIKTGNNKLLQQFCIPLIDFAIEHCTVESGGLKTWILPKTSRNSFQERQFEFNQTKWGEGPDAEVVANFLYTLQLLSPDKYAGTIDQGVEYLMKEQSSEGFWNSRWYFGNYYGTYVSTRVLQHAEDNPSIKQSKQKTLDFVLNTQQSDGGWGINNADPDVLNTSLAILILKKIDSERSKKVIQKGKNFILECREANNTWSPVDFIRPRINEPYKSRTLTTAYAIRGLIS